MASLTSFWYVPRGLLAAVVCGGLGALVVCCAGIGWTVGRWYLEGTSPFQRVIDIKALKDEWVFALMGVSAVTAAAGWVGFAPARPIPFASALGYVFLGCLPIWVVAGSMNLTPRRYKALEHPRVYFSEVLLTIGPPLAVAGVLSFVRGVRERGVRVTNPT